MEGHKIILSDFLNFVKGKNAITNILDAGSGRTSLSTIVNTFPNTIIDAVVYPGDQRKICSIKEIAENSKNINLIEKDICSEIIVKEYDIIIAHLLLGEAAKFGNAFKNLLEKVVTMKYKYLIIINYLEDPAVSEKSIVEICEKYNLNVINKSYVANDKPQVWEDFVGKHNFGYLIKRL